MTCRGTKIVLTFEELLKERHSNSLGPLFGVMEPLANIYGSHVISCFILNFSLAFLLEGL
jgi:hypothetical protein